MTDAHRMGLNFGLHLLFQDKSVENECTQGQKKLKMSEGWKDRDKENDDAKRTKVIVEAKSRRIIGPHSRKSRSIFPSPNHLPFEKKQKTCPKATWPKSTSCLPLMS